MKIVVTPHQHSFLRWCRENDLSPKDVIFCDRPEKVYGRSFTIDDVVWEYEWYKIQDIQPIIMSRIRTKDL